MRVISGLRRGKKLKTVKGMLTRPTSDRVKEGVFNVLREKIPGSRILDLFAGTGNIGIEALSRGAEEAFFVEKNPQAFKVLKTNVEECDFNKASNLYLMDAFVALKVFKKNNLNFNLIYLDPPYKFSNLEKIIKQIIEFSLLANEGVVVVETGKNTNLPCGFLNLHKIKESVYGDTKVTYYQLMKEEERNGCV